MTPPSSSADEAFEKEVARIARLPYAEQQAQYRLLSDEHDKKAKAAILAATVLAKLNGTSEDAPPLPPALAQGSNPWMLKAAIFCGVSFASVCVVGSYFVYTTPPTGDAKAALNMFALVPAVLAGLSVGFGGGKATLDGEFKIPFMGDNPWTVGLSGGMAAAAFVFFGVSKFLGGW